MKLFDPIRKNRVSFTMPSIPRIATSTCSISSFASIEKEMSGGSEKNLFEVSPQKAEVVNCETRFRPGGRNIIKLLPQKMGAFPTIPVNLINIRVSDRIG